MTQHMPINIDVNEKQLEITWTTTDLRKYPSAILRSHCQCAACVSEVTGDVLIDRKKIAATEMTITYAQPQGNYGVALGFSDGHNTGIYTYEFLFSMR